MIKKFLLMTTLLLIGTCVFAEEIPITITPVYKISTADKNLHEGDTVEFKDINNNKIIKGTIKFLSHNGFAGEQASIIIGNFRYDDSGKILNGEIYIKGNEHKRYQDMADSGLVPATVFIRGGEVILKPEKTKLVVFYSDYINTEDTPLKITPAQKISTCYDEIEVGDKIKFVTIKDAYKNGKLYIKKGTPVYGIVDYVSNNGWTYDNAQIDFKTFKLKNINGQTITLSSPLSINGFEILQYKGKRFAQFFNYCGVIFRGKEIEIIPNQDNIEFNIWLR